MTFVFIKRHTFLHYMHKCIHLLKVVNKITNRLPRGKKLLSISHTTRDILLITSFINFSTALSKTNFRLDTL